MSLARYCHDKRPLVQTPSATAFEAACALKSNHVGAIMVQEHGRLIGIVTDRDLAMRAMCSDLEAKRTALRDIMTPDPFTLPLDASEREAVTVMRARHIRRIPVVEQEHVVGIVTLDDLLISGAIDGANAGAIVEGQLAEPAEGKPAGELYPMHQPPERDMAESPRHAAHARQTLAGFKARLARSLGVNDEDTALAAFELVVSTLARRLLPSEAKDLAAQLPWALKQELRDLPATPDLSVTRDSLEADLATALDLDEETAELLVERVAASLVEFVSPGEVEQVVGQLPRDLKRLFPRAHRRGSSDPTW